MFSIIMPMDTNRLQQFVATKMAYDEMPEKKEFVIPSRTSNKIRAFMKRHDLLKDVRIIPYEIYNDGFNPTRALNIGVRNAKYDILLVTGPEVKPHPDTLKKLAECKGQNVICRVWDQDESGKLTSLVHNGYRDKTPQPYFLGMFNKADIEKINGWDEDFMDGYAYEDNDFGNRWVRAGLPFTVREDIQATHQYHLRGETIPGGLSVNLAIYNRNNEQGVTYCKNGLDMVNYK